MQTNLAKSWNESNRINNVFYVSPFTLIILSFLLLLLIRCFLPSHSLPPSRIPHFLCVFLSTLSHGFPISFIPPLFLCILQNSIISIVYVFSEIPLCTYSLTGCCFLFTLYLSLVKLPASRRRRRWRASSQKEQKIYWECRKFQHFPISFSIVIVASRIFSFSQTP